MSPPPPRGHSPPSPLGHAPCLWPRPLPLGPAPRRRSHLRSPLSAAAAAVYSAAKWRRRAAPAPPLALPRSPIGRLGCPSGGPRRSLVRRAEGAGRKRWGPARGRDAERALSRDWRRAAKALSDWWTGSTRSRSQRAGWDLECMLLCYWPNSQEPRSDWRKGRGRSETTALAAGRHRKCRGWDFRRQDGGAGEGDSVVAGTVGSAGAERGARSGRGGAAGDDRSAPGGGNVGGRAAEGGRGLRVGAGPTWMGRGLRGGGVGRFKGAWSAVGVVCAVIGCGYVNEGAGPEGEGGA